MILVGIILTAIVQCFSSDVLLPVIGGLWYLRALQRSLLYSTASNHRSRTILRYFVG
ncbi:hypothetical protein BJV77DRAFT_995873, partial [Russula vinacea]